ncbi:peptidoglycan editing factor PgeF [Mucisphaera sp.]|uniref:peptidoglycan editing factor PgeF n=1 Tax=Mucisphaera sp. TaxID=2913024 RepID=UPI003D0C5877
MLERITHDNQVVTYQSPLLRSAGAVHAFTTRLGGVSKGSYASLNLGPLRKGEGDPNMHVAENYRRLRKALHIERRMRLEARQVHGSNVHLDNDDRVPVPDQAPQADALITRDPRKIIVIRTADCVPILITTPDASLVAGIHAGWRGFVAEPQGIIRACVTRFLEQTDTSASSLLAAIGPCISLLHFEVGTEVAEAFKAHGYDRFISTDHGPKPHIDLPAAAHATLLDAGLQPDHIDTTDRCTFEHETEFFSYRRDRGLNGQMASVIGCA